MVYKPEAVWEGRLDKEQAHLLYCRRMQVLSAQASVFYLHSIHSEGQTKLKGDTQRELANILQQVYVIWISISLF